MAIIHNDKVFPHAFHENPVYGSYDRPVKIQTWHGVLGARTILGRSKTREIVLRATLTYYASEMAFNAARRDIETWLDSGLSGALLIGDTIFPQCLFMGWFPEGEREGQHFYSPTSDAGGTHGWTQRGVLRWTETKVIV